MKLFTAQPGSEFLQPSAAQYPDLRAENRVFGILAVILLLAGLLCASAFAFLSSPDARRLKIGELERMYLLREFYETLPAEAQGKQLYLGIGDSVTASGFNAYAFDRLAGPDCIGYNLSIARKANCEYFYDLAEPRLHDAVVISLVNPVTTFSEESYQLDARKSDMYSVLDYNTDRQAWADYAQLVPASHADAALLPRWRHVVDSRWRFRTHLFSGVERNLPGSHGEQRMDEGVQGLPYNYDIKHPSVPGEYNERSMQRNMEQRRLISPGLIDGGFKPSAASLLSFRLRVRELEKSCAQLVLVISPLHPEIVKSMGAQGVADYKAAVQACTSAHVRIIDLSDKVEFLHDDVHITDAASVPFTEELCRQLGVLQPEGGAATGVDTQP